MFVYSKLKFRCSCSIIRDEHVQVVLGTWMSKILLLIFLFIIHKYSNWWKYLQEVGVDSWISSLMFEKCLILHEKCPVLVKVFFKTYAWDCLVLAGNFVIIQMRNHFPARNRSDQKLKIRNYARNAGDRCICLSAE